MFRIIFLMLLLANFSHAATLNHTRIDECARSFLTNNDTETFNNCLSTAEIRSKKPQSCYQADAGEQCFLTAVKVSGAIFAASILAAIMPTIINWIQATQCSSNCCDGCRSDLPDNDSPDAGGDLESGNRDIPSFMKTGTNPNIPIGPTNLAYLKKISTVTFGQIAAYFSIAISFASASQLFTLWQAWTIARANCAYDLAK
jgi:hypothetical protein